jgi:hypothetical protein
MCKSICSRATFRLNVIVAHPSVLFVANSDHVGVPNATLVKEGSHLAKIYKNKSVAEQNSGKRHRSMSQ